MRCVGDGGGGYVTTRCRDVHHQLHAGLHSRLDCTAITQTTMVTKGTKTKEDGDVMQDTFFIRHGAEANAVVQRGDRNKKYRRKQTKASSEA